MLAPWRLKGGGAGGGDAAQRVRASGGRSSGAGQRLHRARPASPAAGHPRVHSSVHSTRATHQVPEVYVAEGGGGSGPHPPRAQRLDRHHRVLLHLHSRAVEGAGRGAGLAGGARPQTSGQGGSGGQLGPTPKRQACRRRRRRAREVQRGVVTQVGGFLSSQAAHLVGRHAPERKASDVDAHQRIQHPLAIPAAAAPAASAPAAAAARLEL